MKDQCITVSFFFFLAGLASSNSQLDGVPFKIGQNFLQSPKVGVDLLLSYVFTSHMTLKSLGILCGYWYEIIYIQIINNLINES